MSATSRNSFDVIRPLEVGGRRYRYFSLDAVEQAGIGPVSKLPRSLKVLLENLLRHEDGEAVTEDGIRAVARAGEEPVDMEIPFRPARLMMPDSSGIQLIADLAAMRDAMVELGGDPDGINPVVPVDVIVDHSVMVDVAGTPDAVDRNMEIEFARNGERYEFIKWGQQAFENFRVIPPGMGICHQVNLEYLARVVWQDDGSEPPLVYPDTLLGMDSHTPMINSLGIVGWGVGGIEAASAMLGQPVAMRLPEVIGCRLIGRPGAGVTTTDVVLTVTQVLRTRDLVGKFVEFFGEGAAALPATERATLSNMAPEYGSTVGFFAVDEETLRYLRLTGREDTHIALVEAHAKAQGLWGVSGEGIRFSDVVDIDLGAIEPSVAGPKLPHARLPLSETRGALAGEFPDQAANSATAFDVAGQDYRLHHGDVVLAAITSCTNTSNPSVMVAAGLLARNAVAKGLRAKPWVKTSLAPGSRVVADYLERSGLQASLDRLGFNVIGFGCTTCMGNSGPLAAEISSAIVANDIVACAVLSGNRNFEGRVHALVKANFLASPPLVVAFAIAGTTNIDLANDPLGEGPDGKPVTLEDIWPDGDEIRAVMDGVLTPHIYSARYAEAEEGPPAWRELSATGSTTFAWNEDSGYFRRPPMFRDMKRELPEVRDILGARVLALAGDSVTTDHISPVGGIPEDSPAGRYLVAQGIQPANFNNYASRRTNADVGIRGTFANVRFRNDMVPDRTGGFTRHMPDDEEMTIYDAAVRYRSEGVPLVVVAGYQYGAGSSRDWAARGPRFLGVRAILASGFERIHRSNLVGMGVLPLQFPDGMDRYTLGVDGTETIDVTGLSGAITPRTELECRIIRADGSSETVPLICRLDTSFEVECFLNGGILHYVLRDRLQQAA